MTTEQKIIHLQKQSAEAFRQGDFDRMRQHDQAATRARQAAQDEFFQSGYVQNIQRVFRLTGSGTI